MSERVVGVDGYPRGWLAVSLEGGEFEAARLFSDIEGVCAACREAACVAVDIPIGGGPREGDEAARRFVGPRRASVFRTPPSEIVALGDYAEALRRHPGLSRQTFSLFAKIREVARCADPRLIEIHPEVSFRALKGEHLRHSKTTWTGFMERRRLLARAGIEIPEDLGARMPLVDVLDAVVAAWSARRYARGAAGALGDPPAIWY